jgi:hypothetical protein
MQPSVKLASLLTILLSMGCTGVLAAPPDDRTGALKSAQGSLGRSPAEAAAFFRNVFKDASSDDLSKLRENSSPSISIRSAWETVARTISEKQTERPTTVDRSALSWFLGFVEGRIRVSPPHEWQELVYTARSFSRSKLGFGANNLNWGYKEIGAGFRGQAGLKVSSAGAGFVLTTNSSSVHLRRELLGEKRWLSYLANDGKLYLASHDDFCLPYKLFCVDMATGKLQWESRVWAAGGLVNYEGTGGHSVQLTMAGDSVIVFGIGTDAAYIEEFRASDGAVSFRFSTSL